MCPGVLDSLRQRIDFGRLTACGVVRQVEHADVQTVGLPVLDDPIDRRNHLRHIDSPGVVGHLHADDASVGCHADEIRLLGVQGIGTGRAAGDDTGDVGAVTVGVEAGDGWDATLEREVGPHHDLGRGELGDGYHPGVDDGDVYAVAGVSGRPELVGSDLGDDIAEARAVSGWCR